EQHVFRGRPAGNQHRHRLGLGEAAQVVEVAVRPVVIQHIRVAHPFRRGGQDGDGAAPHHLHQLAAAAGEFVFAHGGGRAAGGKRQCSSEPGAGSSSSAGGGGSAGWRRLASSSWINCTPTRTYSTTSA